MTLATALPARWRNPCLEAGIKTSVRSRKRSRNVLRFLPSHSGSTKVPGRIGCGHSQKSIPTLYHRRGMIQTFLGGNRWIVTVVPRASSERRGVAVVFLIAGSPKVAPAAGLGVPVRPGIMPRPSFHHFRDIVEVRCECPLSFPGGGSESSEPTEGHCVVIRRWPARTCRPQQPPQRRSRYTSRLSH